MYEVIDGATGAISAAYTFSPSGERTTRFGSSSNQIAYAGQFLLAPSTDTHQAAGQLTLGSNQINDPRTGSRYRIGSNNSLIGAATWGPFNGFPWTNGWLKHDPCPALVAEFEAACKIFLDLSIVVNHLNTIRFSILIRAQHAGGFSPEELQRSKDVGKQIAEASDRSKEARDDMTAKQDRASAAGCKVDSCGNRDLDAGAKSEEPEDPNNPDDDLTASYRNNNIMSKIAKSMPLPRSKK